jgi:hypothetical protein
MLTLLLVTGLLLSVVSLVLSSVIELTCEYLGHEERTRETRENNNPVTSNRVNM